MGEEFHGDRSTEPWQYKLLYGWSPLNTNVWLPSLSELVGVNPNNFDNERGCYDSVMQGLNISSDPHVMEQGGAQWTYLSLSNADGGGALLWKLGGEHEFWLRSLDYAQSHAIVLFQNDSTVRYIVPVTDTHAVHPAVSSMQVSYRSLFSKGREKLTYYTASPLPKKARMARLFSCKRLHDGSHILPPFCGEGRIDFVAFTSTMLTSRKNLKYPYRQPS